MRYRIAAAFAGLAMVVALIAGLAGGVHVGTVLARSVLGAALFGGLGLVIVRVVERYLPDLLSPLPGRSQGGRDGPDKRIDIVLPEENPLAGEEGEPEALEPMGEPVEDLEPVEQGVLRGAPGEELSEGNLDEPVGEPEPMEPEPLEPEGRPAAAGSTLPLETGTVDDVEEIESLPSLEGRPSGPEPPRSRGANPMSDAIAQGDPSQAARALRTWLRRDDEG